MTALHTTILGLCLLVIGVFGALAGLWFRSRGADPPGLNLVKVVGLPTYAAVIAAVALGEVRGVTAWVGGAMIAGGGGLAVWAWRANAGRALSRVYCEDLPEHLVTRGPYRLLRHPFYAAYLLAFAGAAVAGRALWLVPVVLFHGGLYVHAARFEEAKFARSGLAGAYEAYRARTGMLLPSLAGVLRARRRPDRSPWRARCGRRRG